MVSLIFAFGFINFNVFLEFRMACYEIFFLIWPFFTEIIIFDVKN